MEPDGSAANGVYGDEDSTVQIKIEYTDVNDKDLPGDRIFVESGSVRQEDGGGEQFI